MAKNRNNNTNINNYYESKSKGKSIEKDCRRRSNTAHHINHQLQKNNSIIEREK